MPAKSKQQQKFMGMVHALNKGDIKPSDVSKSVRDVAKNIKKSDAEDFASTKHSGLPKKVKEQILNALKEYANKMAGNKLGGGGSHDYAPQKGLRDDDGYEDNEGPKDEGFASDAQRRAAFASGYKAKGKKGKKESVNEGMFSTLDQIRKDSKDVRDFVKNVFKDRDFMKMKNDKEFIKYLKSIYEGVDESKGVPQNYMQGRTSDYHTALRGKNRDYSGGTNFKKSNSGQPDIKDDDEDQETNQLSVQQTPVKEAIGGMSNKAIEDEMKRHGIKKIPIDSHGLRLLKGLQKEKFINKVDNLYKLTYFYATIPKGKRYTYGSAKKPLSPLFDYFQNELMGQNIILTSKMAAYRVAQNIIDMYNNNEEIDSPYYLLKNYFNSFGMDTNRSRTFNGAQYHLDQWLKRNKKYEKAMMKEAKLDHHRISGNSIELLVRHNREKLAIRFKDKRILDKMGFDWSKPKNIEKLLSLKKLPKGMSISKSFHEYGQRLDLSYLEDEEARLKGTPKPKDAIDRDIEEYSGGSYEYTKGDQYGQNSVNEIGIFPIQNYVKGIIPSNFIDSTTRDKKERLRSTLRDLKNTLNHFWKQHKIPYRIK